MALQQPHNPATASAIVSTSSTRSFRSKRRAIDALWIFIFSLPTPSAPNVAVPSRSVPSSFASIPSMPGGGTAFRSAANRSRPAHASRGTSVTPAGPVLSSSSAPSRTAARLGAAGHGQRPHRAAEPLLDAGDESRISSSPGRDDDIRTGLGQQACRTQADRSRPCCDDHAPASHDRPPPAAAWRPPRRLSCSLRSSRA